MSKKAAPSVEAGHALEAALGHVFNTPALLERALTHPSYAADHNNRVLHYERLEFLGDAVLQLVVSEMIFLRFHQEKEGDLAKRRAALVCGETLAEIARAMHVGKYLRLGNSEESCNGRHNPANLENALEALIAAIYMDGGLEPARKFIEKYFTPVMDSKKSPPKDAKTALQEWTQSHNLPLPEYVVVSQTGPAHAPEFTMELRVEGQEAVRAKASNKKLAERTAASMLCDALGIAR